MNSKDKKRKKDQQKILKIIVANPEALPIAQERFTKFAYEAYMQALREGRIKQVEE